MRRRDKHEHTNGNGNGNGNNVDRPSHRRTDMCSRTTVSPMPTPRRFSNRSSEITERSDRDLHPHRRNRPLPPHAPLRRLRTRRDHTERAGRDAHRSTSQSAPTTPRAPPSPATPVSAKRLTPPSVTRSTRSRRYPGPPTRRGPGEHASGLLRCWSTTRGERDPTAKIPDQ
jgi:hypothetical protein